VLSLVIFLVIRQGVQNYNIEGPSMEPSFLDGQFVLVNKLAYKLGEPERGDVIVFKNPGNEKEDYIKRVIGLPGDTVSFADEHVYVNGELIDDDLLVMGPTHSRGEDIIVVSPDHLFVMGDNRRNSRDSRDFGVLDEDLLIGRAWVRIWPVSDWGRVGHAELEPGVPFQEQE
jgi:signal peptidase I